MKLAMRRTNGWLNYKQLLLITKVVVYPLHSHATHFQFTNQQTDFERGIIDELF